VFSIYSDQPNKNFESWNALDVGGKFKIYKYLENGKIFYSCISNEGKFSHCSSDFSTAYNVALLMLNELKI
jgi:hypothetical protein